MPRIILQTLTVAGLVMSASAMASAASAIPTPPPNAGVQNDRIERIDYYWNHRRYQHRNWDKRHRHWHYY